MNDKLRAPSVPLVTIDPYFSVWSPADRLTDRDTTHWTGRANLVLGVATIDGAAYRFIGRGPEPAMEQTGLDITATSSTYTFRAAGVELVADFTSPLLLDDLDGLLGLLGDRLTGELLPPFVYCLGSDSGERLDDLLDLVVVVDRCLELLDGVDSDGLELLDVLVLQTSKICECLHGHSFTLCDLWTM